METHKHGKQKQSFVYHYKNAATIIGSLVVLGSFVTKEIVQDRLKSTIESLDSADQIFQVRSDSAFQQMQLTSMSESIENVRLEAQGTPTNKKKIEEKAKLRRTLQDVIKQDTMIIQTALENAKYSNQGVREFIKPIRNVEPLELEIDNSDKKLDEMLKANNLLRSRDVDDFLDEDDFEGPMPNEDVYIEELNHVRREVVDARDRALRSTEVSAGLREKALDASKRFRIEIEKKYQRYTLAIYILFGAGWLLGLGARLLGLDTPEVSE